LFPPRSPGETAIRIGIAHGSLGDRDNLPADDHLIDRYVVDERGLDYLALGHWHRPSRHPDRRSIVRTVYPGVPEPMRFPATSGNGDSPVGIGGFQTGWTAYSNAAADLFADDGHGRVVLVNLDRAGAEPSLEVIEVGHFCWSEESYRIQSEDDIARLIGQLALRPNGERQLLRLHLEGILSAEALVRRCEELENGVLRSYCWAELDAERLHAAPEDDALRQLVGSGVLRAVYERIRQEETSPDEAVRQRAAHGLLALYRLAQEVR
jgi:DNA repair exonuclease SbcCD nuclease subunit